MPKKIRPIRIEGNIAYVPLTQGYEAIIDVTDVDIVSGVNWYVRRDGGQVYAGCNIPKNESGKRGHISMHRLIMGNPQQMEVDHRDANGINNRRGNLRVASKSQNQANRKTSKLNISGFKGVSPYKRDGTWHARISKDGKRFCLGYYKTPEEAHLAYINASREMHGSFGRTK